MSRYRLHGSTQGVRLKATQMHVIDRVVNEPVLAVAAIARILGITQQTVVMRLAQKSGDATLLCWPKLDNGASGRGRPPSRSSEQWGELRDRVRLAMREHGNLRAVAAAVGVPRTSLQRELARIPIPLTVVAMPEGLAERHARLLATESGITPEVAAARGYRTSKKTGDLIIPICGANGLQWLQQRLDMPEGSHQRYVNEGGARACVDVPPAGQEMVRDVGQVLLVTEGPRKADAAVSHGLPCVDFPGTGMVCDATMNANAWAGIPLGGRRVVVAFDCDVVVNPNVALAEQKVVAFLQEQGARVETVEVPRLATVTTLGRDLHKAGLDDYFGAGGSPEALLALAQKVAKSGPPAEPPPSLTPMWPNPEPGQPLEHNAEPDFEPTVRSNHNSPASGPGGFRMPKPVFTDIKLPAYYPVQPVPGGEPAVCDACGGNIPARHRRFTSPERPGCFVHLDCRFLWTKGD